MGWNRNKPNRGDSEWPAGYDPGYDDRYNYEFYPHYDPFRRRRWRPSTVQHDTLRSTESLSFWVSVWSVVIAAWAFAVCGLTIEGSYPEIRRVTLGVGWVVLPIGWLLTSQWLARARGNVEVVDPAATHRRPYFWAWVGWISPYATWFVPMQYVRDVLRAKHGNESKTLLLNLWWTMWLAAILTMLFAVAVGGGSEPGTDDLVISQMIALICVATSTALWLAVVEAISNDQRFLFEYAAQHDPSGDSSSWPAPDR